MDIGIYHLAAGKRNAGGKPVYNRRMAAALSKVSNPTLYTAASSRGFFEDADFEVVEIPDWPGNELHDRLTAGDPIRLNSSLSYLFARRNGLNHHIDDRDVLLTHKWYEDLVVSRTTETPTVYQYHGVENYGIGANTRDLLSAAGHELANSTLTRRRLEREQGKTIDGIVRPGVDTEEFHPDAEPAFNSDDPTILFVGRFEEVKGVETLLEAFASLAENARLLYLGDGSKHETLDRRAKTLGIDDSVVFGGVVPNEEIAGYYTAADIVCHPSRYEGFGMTNLEAMACGAALVTTPFGFVEEFGTADETHLEVDPGNPKQLTRALESLLDDPELRATLGENARELAKDHTWDRRAEKMLTLCEEFLEEYE